MLVTIIGIALLYQGIRTVVAERFLQARGATTMAEIESLYAREAYSNIRKRMVDSTLFGVARTLLRDENR